MGRARQSKAVVRLAKRYGSFVRDDELAFVSPFDENDDQDTDPRPGCGGHKTADA